LTIFRPWNSTTTTRWNRKKICPNCTREAEV